MFYDPLDKWLWNTPIPLPPTTPAAPAWQDTQHLLELGNLADPQLIPFWRETAVATLPHNSYHYEHLTIAAAALTLIAIHRQSEIAIHTLRHLTNNSRPDIRELAIHYLGRAYTEAGRPFPHTLLNDITLIAQHDTAFEPRYQARRILQIAGEPLPLDNPNGVYDFKVTPMHSRRTYRTIAIRSEQTLRDLQRFIQHAFEWDNDHLYSFYLNGRKYDGRYRFSSSYEENRPPWAYEAIIGQIGFPLGHHLLYHFDYTADHLFEIEVTAIRPQIRAGNYPRIIADHGKPPAQYA